MKKVILFSIALLAAIYMNAQTVNVHFKNGQTVQYNSSEVDFVDFSEKGSEPIDPTPVNPPTESKRIVKIVENDGTETTLSYDSNGRVTRILTTGSIYGISETTYQYSDTQIVCIDKINGTTTYTVENGRIIKEVGSENVTYYTYNNGYLTSLSRSNGTKITFDWTDGNMTSFTKRALRPFSYSDVPWHKGMIFYYEGTSLDKYLWLSGYWGKTPRNLPSEDHYKGLRYDFILSNGLVTECKINNRTFWTFTWE